MSRAAVILRVPGRILVSNQDEDRPLPTTRTADDPEAAARELAAELSREPPATPTIVRTGRRIDIDGDSIVPVLFDLTDDPDPDASDRSPELDRESAVSEPERSSASGVEPEVESYSWVSPTALHRSESSWAWMAYESVSPTVRSVTRDDEHGSAYLSVRALEVLRDRAGLLDAEGASDADAWDELADLATRLRTARPGMAGVRNRVNRTMADADGDPWAVETVAEAAIERAATADARAARRAAPLIDDEVVLTLSRSGTVLGAFADGTPRRIVTLASNPGNEGIDVAESLADEHTVTIAPDAAAGHLLSEADRVLVGADAIGPDGTVLNKVGTRTVAVVAASEGVPVTVVAASDKVDADGTLRIESAGRSTVYDGDAPVDVASPLFDRTPPELVDRIVTERGTVPPDGIAALADERRSLTEW